MPSVHSILPDGNFADALNERVAVIFAFGEDGKDERNRGSGDEFLRKHGGTIPNSARLVKCGVKVSNDE